MRKNGRLLAVIASSERLATSRSRVCRLFFALSFALTQKKQKIKTAEKKLKIYGPFFSPKTRRAAFPVKPRVLVYVRYVFLARPLAQKCPLIFYAFFRRSVSHCPGQPEMAGLIFVLKHMILS